MPCCPCRASLNPSISHSQSLPLNPSIPPSLLPCRAAPAATLPSPRNALLNSVYPTPLPRPCRARSHPAIPDGLDLVETSDQITHEISLDDPLDTKVGGTNFSGGRAARRGMVAERDETRREVWSRQLIG